MKFLTKPCVSSSIGFGYDASNDEAIANSLHRLENARWHQALENIYVVEAGNVSFDVVVPASWAGEYFDLEIFRQNDAERVDVSYEVVNEEQSAFVDGQELLRLQINIKTTLNIGYYDVRLNVKNKHYKTLLAVAPKRCYEAPAMAHKLWGFSIQLYSVKVTATGASAILLIYAAWLRYVPVRERRSSDSTFECVDA